jgi:hypothetical protein
MSLGIITFRTNLELAVWNFKPAMFERQHVATLKRSGWWCQWLKNSDRKHRKGNKRHNQIHCKTIETTNQYRAW